MITVRTFAVLCLCICSAYATCSAAKDEHPLIVAHRGLLHHAPENTLPNFRACLELRLGFEFDVRKTRDGRLVCIHDETVERTTNGTGKVSELTLKEIRQLDAGSPFDPTFAGVKVPTVKEIFRLVAEYRQHNMVIAVDLKAEDVASVVVRLAEHHKIMDKLLFIGRTIFEPTVRQKIHETSEKAHAATLANNAAELSEAVSDPHADWIYLRFLPTEEQIETVRHAGKKLFIAGPPVSDNWPANWNEAARLGLMPF